MKKWKCTVCGYIYEGGEPPEFCPVCGADRTKFIEITEGAEKIFEKPWEIPQAKKPGTGFRAHNLAVAWMTRLHAHPISVHIPNGVLPVAVLFLFLASFFQIPTLGLAAFYNLIVVVLAMPLVFFSGYIDWKTRFGGHLNSLFIGKMACGIFIFVLGLVLVVWRMVNPTVANADSGRRMIFLLLHLFILAAAGLAGYLGGKLVFKVLPDTARK